MKSNVESENEQSLEHRSRTHSRIRRTKQLLRPLPRRATLHRWPVIKWFAKAARKSPYLWRFGERETRLAIYLGSVIAFLPIFGVQFLAAFLVAFAARCNMLIIMSVQLVTNIGTIWFIYPLTVKVGDWIVNTCNLPSLHPGVMKVTYNAVIGGIVVGLAFGLIADLVFRFFFFRRLNKSVNVKRMLKT